VAFAYQLQSKADVVGPWVAPFNHFYEPDVLAYPQNAKPENWCGFLGRRLSADVAVNALGWAAYFFATASLSVVLVIVFPARQDLFAAEPRSRLRALLLLRLLHFACDARHLSTSESPVVGGGGYLVSLSISLESAITSGVRR
jgi:hypothetical protein